MPDFQTVIYLDPVPKARPRFSAARTYKDKKSVKNEDDLRHKLMIANRGNHPLIGPLSVRLVCHLPRPKSRKKDVHHTVKPDADNLAKFFCDVANGILWRDDAQISMLQIWKKYGDIGCWEVEIDKLE